MGKENEWTNNMLHNGEQVIISPNILANNGGVCAIDGGSAC
jgi:hypothetical protein